MRTILCFCILGATAAASFAAPGLPSWDDGERDGLEKSGWIAGESLLTDEPLPETPETPEAKTGERLDVAQPTADEIGETEIDANQIPEEFWPEYFEARPKSFLVDPQGLLGPVDQRDRLGFLTYHAGDSSIDLYVYVFKGDQEIPGELREEEIVERFFSEGRPAVVVYYFMGAPQRSMLYLSPSLTDAVPPAEQRRAMESSVMQAFKDVDPSKQIEAFLVQMSIRIYWMERMLGGGAEEEAAAVIAPAKVAGEKAAVSGKYQPMIEGAKRFAVPSAAAGGILLAMLAASAWLRSRERCRFPDFEVEPRLGGAHAAGVGAVISFASAALPPASQRDQVPDYLRRA